MEIAFVFEDLMYLLPGMLSGIPSLLFSVACYVLGAYAIYTVASRRGLSKPWLAWIPVVNCFLLGSLSDQYCYVVKRQNKNKRSLLLGLNVAKIVLSVLLTGMTVAALAPVIFDIGHGRRPGMLLLWVLGLSLPTCAAAIAFSVLRYMALYDLYKSMEPDNAVLFLVMSILFHPTEAFFLFFNRDKDLGMPPRRQRPAEPAFYAVAVEEEAPPEDNTEFL